MKTTNATAPRGQVLIITAATMIVILGIAAIVIDLGLSWMLRRQEQNAADPASVAAARWLKDPLTGDAVDPATVQTQMNADACFYAQENGFFAGDAGCINALAAGDLQVHSPPISGPYSATQGHVQVIITERHDAFFGRIWGQSIATVRTDATSANVAHNSNSSSLVALQPVCQAGSAGDVDGGAELHIFPTAPNIVGGYVHVNSPCGSSTNDICDNGVGQAALSISGELSAPFTNVVGSCTVPGGGPGLVCDPPVVAPDVCLDEAAVPLGDPLAGLPEPVLADFPNGVCPGGAESTPASTSGCRLQRAGTDCPPDPVDSTIDICTLTPGVYYGGWSIGSRVRLFLEPGMYILAGGGISLAGGSASLEAVTSPTVSEARIMIFSTDGPGCPSIGAQCQDVVRFQSSQAFRAKALNAATCGLVSPQACPWKGILLWQDGSASNPDAVVHLGGQSSSILAGTIYAPKAQVEVNGGGAGTGCSGPTTASCLAIQIISYRWFITGGGRVDMPYDPSELYQLPSRGLVD